METRDFQELVWAEGRARYRDMPWRDEPTLYHVLVSELMLQQTQVARVRVKYAAFMEAFPSIEALAEASLADVLRVWSGLGYNRRAKFLHEAAKQLRQGTPPTTLEALVTLPGVGPNTAGAIMNYVYEVPTPYVETNIRTVYFAHFYRERTGVSDKEVLAKVEETMDREHPREWFWALMDYGAALKSEGQARLDTSSHYKKQAPLRGSIREVRGQIIAILTRTDAMEQSLRIQLQSDERFTPALAGLIRDGLVERTGTMLHLTK